MTKRLHPAYIVTSALATLRNLAIPLIIVFVSGGGFMEVLSYVGIIGIIVVGIATRAVAWWRFTYEVTARELRVHSGVLSRTERALPLERIHAVDVNEGVLERLLGVVRVKVETAAGGSAGSDVTLDALSRAEAADLRAHLLAARRPSDADPTADIAQPSPAEPILRLTTGRLLAAGATSGRIGPALAILAGAFQFADDILGERVWGRVVSAGSDASFQGIVVLLTVAAAGAWLLAIGSMALTFGRFELRRDGDRLLISHGLLERRRSTIPLARVQAVTISEGMLRQPLGLASVRIESAGYGKDTAESGVLAPIIHLRELHDLLTRACPSHAVDLTHVTLTRPPARARRRYISSEILPNLPIPVIAVVVAAFIPGIPWWWGLAGFVLVLVGVIFGPWRYHDAGWALDDGDHLIVRERSVARVTAIAERRRLQLRAVSQDRFQRRAALATFQTAVASGGAGGLIRLRHLDQATAADLLHRLRPRPAPARPHIALTAHDPARDSTPRIAVDPASDEETTPVAPRPHPAGDDAGAR
ncbi:MAG: PH domain-containing protein [Thermomicrobiales bacterium]